MLDAISAEALKFRRHRATWGLVWIWPIGVTLILAARDRVRSAKGDGRPRRRRPPPAGSTNAVDFWNVPPSRRPLSDRRLRRGRVRRRIWLEHLEADRPAPRAQQPHRRQICRRSGPARSAASRSRAILFNLLGWLEDLATGDPIPGRASPPAALLKAHGLAALAALGRPAHRRLCEPRRDPDPLDRRRARDRPRHHHARAALPRLRADARALCARPGRRALSGAARLSSRQSRRLDHRGRRCWSVPFPVGRLLDWRRRPRSRSSPPGSPA